MISAKSLDDKDKVFTMSATVFSHWLYSVKTFKGLLNELSFSLFMLKLSIRSWISQ